MGLKAGQLVALNHSFEAIGEQCFTVDHVLGGRLAARALLDHKHRHIAIIEGPRRLADNADRINGFMAELRENGIDADSIWRVESDFSPAGGWAAAKQLLESGYQCTALFCANDEMAVGALSYFQESGLRVPHDLSVIGYDDTPSAAYSAPRLTSVHMPWREMTLNGINALLNLCYDMKRPVTRDFPVSVTLRASLSKAAGGKRKAA
jgi:LacI family transcriptional regulator